MGRWPADSRSTCFGRLYRLQSRLLIPCLLLARADIRAAGWLSKDDVRLLDHGLLRFLEGGELLQWALCFVLELQRVELRLELLIVRGCLDRTRGGLLPVGRLSDGGVVRLLSGLIGL